MALRSLHLATKLMFFLQQDALISAALQFNLRPEHVLLKIKINSLFVGIMSQASYELLQDRELVYVQCAAEQYIYTGAVFAPTRCLSN